MTAGPPSSPGNERSRTVLIIDDESTVETFGRMLRLDGYQVLTALSAEEGFCEVETSDPDVILLDLWRDRVSTTATTAARARKALPHARCGHHGRSLCR